MIFCLVFCYDAYSQLFFLFLGSVFEFIVLQSGWTNQFDNKTVEGIRGANAYLTNETISIGGVGVELRTAYDWVEAGHIDKSIVDNAPRITY
jgi:hypothetical protein